jgi:hypothetical protein
MGDSNSWKPATRQGVSPSPSRPTAAPAKPAPALPGSTKPTATNTTDAPSDGLAGRIVHDARGNAVWDWVKDTARIAIDSTSRLLRKLEVPELKVEDTQDQELRIESDRDPGGGYDPYGGGAGAAPTRNAPQSRTTAAQDFGRGSNTGASRGGSTVGSRGDSPTKNIGGGYDPYGKGVTNPPRKR